MRVQLKLTLMATLLLAAAWVAAVYGQTWHWLVCAALGASWVGDALLGRYQPISGNVQDPFIAGMGAFALAQMLYITAFWTSLVRMPELHMRNPGWPLGIEIVDSTLSAYLLAGVLFWVWYILRSDRPALLKFGTLAYGMLVTATGGVACAAMCTGVGYVWPLTLGGLLFIVSDAIIALHIFQDRFEDEKRYEALVWGTYFPAQALLLLGAAWLH